MKAVIYEAFSQPPQVSTVPDPAPERDGVVVKVMATGVCRSDWHGWVGHDPDITLPHVPGHELAGVVAATGRDVKRFRGGDRVTVPFVGGCGSCPQCASGNQQVCDRQFQPGFTHWGSFAELVRLDHADLNLVRLPDQIDFATAASLGCRFVTSFRAVVDQGRTKPGEWLAVHGCGGVGLSAIMIGSALGAQIIAVDIDAEKLALARSLGAAVAIDAAATDDVAAAIREASGGGAHVSLDALGHPRTCFNSIACLRKRGRHVQVGLMAGDHAQPVVPMGRVIADELEIVGSHGIQAHRYDDILAMILAGRFAPERLIGRRISLEESIQVLTTMDRFQETGVVVIDRF